MNVLETRTWRIVSFGNTSSADARIYIAVIPDHLHRACQLVLPILEDQRVDHRYAKEPTLLDTYSGADWWAGKAIIADPHPDQWESLVAELDRCLVGQGLEGPAVIAGARPYGGQSGLLFSRREAKAADAAQSGDSRRQRLTQLLGQ